jgi:hypothetical protein
MRMSITELILEAAKRPNGFATDEIEGVKSKSVSNAARYLERDGRLFKAKGASGRGGGAVRYFDSAERASRCVPVPKYIPQPRPKKVVRKHLVITKRPGRALWDDDAPAIITSETKVTICAPKPDPTRTNTHSLIGG